MTTLEYILAEITVLLVTATIVIKDIRATKKWMAKNQLTKDPD